jgi:hypothetical protein
VGFCRHVCHFLSVPLVLGGYTVHCYIMPLGHRGASAGLLEIVYVCNGHRAQEVSKICAILCAGQAMGGETRVTEVQNRGEGRTTHPAYLRSLLTETGSLQRSSYGGGHTKKGLLLSIH